MKRDQNVTGPPLVAGMYSQLLVPIYTDNTDTTKEPDLSSGVVEWHLKGAGGIDLISKTSSAGIAVNSPSTGYIVVELLETDTAELTSGDYYHIAEFTISGHKRGLFDGIMSIDNRGD